MPEKQGLPFWISSDYAVFFRFDKVRDSSSNKFYFVVLIRYQDETRLQLLSLDGDLLFEQRANAWFVGSSNYDLHLFDYIENGDEGGDIVIRTYRVYENL